MRNHEQAVARDGLQPRENGGVRRNIRGERMRSTLSILLCSLIIAGCRQTKTTKSTNEEKDAEVQSGNDPNAEVLGYSDTQEIVLSMNSMKFMLDLDTGRTMDPPATHRPEQEQMDIHPTQWQPYERPTGLSGLSLRGRKMKPDDWDASVTDMRDVLAHDRVQELTQMKFDPKEPATYFFATRDGTIGILQLLAVVEEPEGIRLRYKTLMRNSDSQ